MKLRPHTLAAVALAALAAPAWAVTTVYTSASAFLANVAPGAYTNTFTGPAVNASSGSYSYAAGGYAYTVTGAPGASLFGTFTNGTLISNNYGARSLTVTFTSGSVTAIGGEFFLGDITPVFQPLAVTLSLSDGSSLSFTPTSQGNAYRGFVSTVPITSLTMAAPFSALYVNAIDNLTVGTAAPVPEPAGWLLALCGFGGLAGVQRARRRR